MKTLNRKEKGTIIKVNFKHRGKSIIKKIGFVFLIFIIVFLLIEFALHSYYYFLASRKSQYRLALFANDNLPKVQPRYQPHPYLTYTLTPNFVDSSGKTRHNSSGFRGPEVREKKGPNSVRIIAIGGSTTYTIKVNDDNKTYPAQLERTLQSVTGNREIEVINSGIGGYTTWESYINLSFRLLYLEPDIIVVYHAANDLHARRVKIHKSDNSGYRRQWQLKWNLPLRAIRFSYSLRILALALTGIKPLGVEHYTRQNDELITNPPASQLETFPPAFFRHNLQLMVRLAKSNNCRVVLCTFATNPDFSDHYASTEFYQMGFVEMNRVIRRVAREEEVTCADVDAALPRDSSII
jgi:lysophospholipase L1-like esterase